MFPAYIIFPQAVGFLTVFSRAKECNKEEPTLKEIEAGHLFRAYDIPETKLKK